MLCRIHTPRHLERFGDTLTALLEELNARLAA